MVQEEEMVGLQRRTYSGNEGGLWQRVVQDECELSTKISHDLAGRNGTPVPQGSVGLDEDSHLIRSLAQAVVLLQVCNVLNVPLEQAEDVIHSAKQPGQDNKALSQVNVIKEMVWQLVPDNERIIGINHDSRQVYFFDKDKMILSKKKNSRGCSWWNSLQAWMKPLFFP